MADDLARQFHALGGICSAARPDRRGEFAPLRAGAAAAALARKTPDDLSEMLIRWGR